jgi:heme oxygenase
MRAAVVRCRGVVPPRCVPATAPVRPPAREPSTSWLNWLGASTVQHHALADRARLAVLDTTSLGTYRGYLERIYGFEAAVEEQASTVHGFDVALYGTRVRLARLRQDLEALGAHALETSTLPRPRVAIQGTSEALGWLFTVERHVLLAGLILRVLASEHSAFAVAFGYLATHPDGGTRLREFGDIVRSAIALGDARADAIAAAARRAFEAQHHWYVRRQKLTTTQPMFVSPAGKGRRSVA